MAVHNHYQRNGGMKSQAYPRLLLGIAVINDLFRVGNARISNVCLKERPTAFSQVYSSLYCA